MATTKKAVKKVVKAKTVPNDTFIIIGVGDDSIVGEATTEELAYRALRAMIADDANDRYYEDNVYSIYKLVKRVRVNIEHPQPVVKLTEIKGQ